MVTNPYFSIIIPVFNRVLPLKRALLSVAHQDFSDYEVIVIDDGSSMDFSVEIEAIVKNVNILNIKLIRYEKNINGAYARNIGIKAAVGQYICLLDSDDEWNQNKLSTVFEYTVQNAPQFVYHQCITLSGKVIPYDGISEGELYTDYCFVRNRRAGAPTSTIAILRELALSNLFNEALVGHQDWDFCLQLESKCIKFDFIDRVLSIRHKSNLDSVGQSLDFDYSLHFFQSRRDQFSLKGASYYHWCNLLPKAIKELRLPNAVFTSKYFWFMFYFVGSASFIDLLKGCKKVYLLKRRLNLVKRKLKKMNFEGDILIYGYNYYGQLINTFLSNKATYFIDSSPSKSIDDSKLVLHVSHLNKVDNNDVAAIILSTDRHYELMTSEVVERNATLAKKIICF